MKKKIILLTVLCLVSINTIGCKKTIDYTENIEPSYTAKLDDISVSFISKTVEVIDNKNCLVLKTNIKNLSDKLIYPSDFFITVEQEYNELLLVDEIIQNNNYNIAYRTNEPIKTNSEITLDYIFELNNNSAIDIYLWTLENNDPILLEENVII